MARITTNLKRTVWILSIVLALSLNFLHVFDIPHSPLVSSNILNIVHMLKSKLTLDDTVAVSIVLGLSGPAAVQFLESKRRSEVLKYIPVLLGHMVECNRKGLDIVRSLQIASSSNLGPLTKELKKLEGRIILGIPFDEAFKYFAKELDTDLSTRIFLIISHAVRDGGNLQLVFDTLHEHIVDLQTIETERRGTMRIFVMIIYIAIFVFLVADALIAKTLFGALVSQREASATLFGSAPIDVSFLQRITYHIAIIQSIFGGLVAGKIEEGPFAAGLKHIVLLILATFITFFIYVR